MDDGLFFLNIRDLSDAEAASLGQRFPCRCARALRYRAEDDRLRSLAAGCLLFEVLRVEESALRYCANGKPRAVGAPEFSLSHSGEYTVLAVSAEAVGVDIEARREIPADAAQWLLSEEERRWAEHSPAARLRALWTLKEAAAKAVDMGLSPALRDFCALPLLRGEAVPLLGVPLYGRTWLSPDYALSVVSAHPPSPTRTRLSGAAGAPSPHGTLPAFTEFYGE